MPYLAGGAVDNGFAPFAFFQQQMGFIPALFRAQTLLPRVIEVEAGIARAVLISESDLSRIRKERLLLGIAGLLGNTYCVAEHSRLLAGLGEDADRIERIAASGSSPDLDGADAALLDFGLRLASAPARVGRRHIEALREAGLSDRQILDAVLVTAMTRFLCTLSTGLGVEPDSPPAFSWDAGMGARRGPSRETVSTDGEDGGYIPQAALTSETFAPFRFFRDRFGFVPNIFRAQTLRPEVVEAEAEAVRLILLTEDVLSRVRKEYILLVVSAFNLNTYCVAVHCEMLRALGVSDEESDQVALNHHAAGLAASDVALLDFSLKLARVPDSVGEADVAALLREGFTQEQVLEAVVMVAMTQFLNTVQEGLGVVPDFPPRLVFSPRASDSMKPETAFGDPTSEADAALVGRLQSGDQNAFETLVQEHGRRIYRTLIGILGSSEEAEDAMQNALLRVFRHVSSFRGESRFTTWLTRIAINEGLQRLRQRRPMESLDDQPESSRAMAGARDVRAWDDNPEQLYSQSQLRRLVEEHLVKLPPAYRMAIMLRDIEQLSTEEAAAALSIPVGTLKTRLFRGRMMLREVLAPHFHARDRGAARA